MLTDPSAVSSVPLVVSRGTMTGSCADAIRDVILLDEYMLGRRRQVSIQGSRIAAPKESPKSLSRQLENILPSRGPSGWVS